MAGAITISIDLELAWGNWDNLTAENARHIEEDERPIIRRLLMILDRYEIRTTWAFVGALLDGRSAKAQPGNETLWYAPEVIEAIRRASTNHDIGSHGGHHRYFDQMSDEEANDDLAFVKEVHDRNDLPLTSFVFPRNLVAKTSLLETVGVKVFRGRDDAWHQSLRDRAVMVGRIANLLDKSLPIRPRAVRPTRSGALVDLPGSLLFFGRNGVRRLIPLGVMRRKLQAGVTTAQNSDGVFHLWFHPSNFWHDADQQFAQFEWFAAAVSKSVSLGTLEIKTMADFA